MSIDRLVTYIRDVVFFIGTKCFSAAQMFWISSGETVTVVSGTF